MAPRTVELARRAGQFDDPEDGLSAVAALRAHLDSLEAQHVELAIRSGVSWSRVAKLLGVSRQAVHKRHAARLREARPRAQPQLVTTAQVRRTVQAACQEAAAMGHRFVGPEHVLLGLLRDDRGSAVDAFEAVGVSFAGARREVRRLYGESETDAPGETPVDPPRISNRVRATLEAALREAAACGDSHLGVGHVLVALLDDPQGGAVRALAALGVTPAELRRELARASGWTDSAAGRSGERTSDRREKLMTDERNRDELTEGELDAANGAELPDRDVMSILPLPDPTGGVALPIPHHPGDSGSEPELSDPGGSAPA